MSKVILICDDDSDLRRFLKRLLSPCCVVAEAGDGREALALIAERRLDLVLLDMTMPGFDGLPTLEAYRKTRPLLPTVVLTGDRELDAAWRAILREA